MTILRLAWRNIWRNARRSAIILASVSIGLAATVFTDNIMRGFVRQAFQNQLGTSTGHIQVHHPQFRDNPLIDHYMDGGARLVETLTAEPSVRAFAPRALINGVVSTARNSTGTRVVGVDPAREPGVTNLGTFLTEGRYLSGEAREAVMSEGMAKTLDVRLGERVVVMAASASGSVSSEVFTVIGLFRSPNAGFDKSNLFVPIADLQRMLGVGDRIAEVALVVDDLERADAIAADLQSSLGAEYEVLPYRRLLPGLVLQLEMTEQSMAIFYAIIGLAMLFGIANTMVMSVFERIHEFGVVKSIGLKDRSLFWLVLTEAALLGLLGIIFGTALGMMVTAPFFGPGINFAWFSEGLRSWGSGAIIYPVVDPVGILTGLLVIEAITIAAALFPAIRAMRLQPVEAMWYV